MNSKTKQKWQLLIVKLKDKIKKEKITHQAIADITGLHRSNVSRFFGVKYSPSLRTYLLIADAISDLIKK